MLIKKEQTDAGELVFYDSSQIEKTLYDYNTQELIIGFRKGGMYSYIPVSEFIYSVFLESDSQGKLFKELIKSNPEISWYKIG